MGRLVAGAVAEQPAHPDVVGVVVLDPLLAAERVADRRLDLLGELQHLGARVAGARPDEERHGAGPRSTCSASASTRSRAGTTTEDGATRSPVPVGWAAGSADTSPGTTITDDPAVGQRGLDRDPLQARHLVRRGDQLDPRRALGEQRRRVGLLEVGGADLGRRDVRGDRQHRRAGAVRVVEAVDEVGVARPAAARADRELPGQLGLGRGGERGGLLVVDVDPVDPALVGAARAPDGVDDRVEAVADQAVDPSDPGLDEHLDQLVGHRGCHLSPSRSALVCADRCARHRCARKRTHKPVRADHRAPASDRRREDVHHAGPVPPARRGRHRYRRSRTGRAPRRPRRPRPRALPPRDVPGAARWRRCTPTSPTPRRCATSSPAPARPRCSSPRGPARTPRTRTSGSTAGSSATSWRPPAPRAPSQHVALMTGLKHYLGPFEAYGEGDAARDAVRRDRAAPRRAELLLRPGGRALRRRRAPPLQLERAPRAHRRRLRRRQRHEHRVHARRLRRAVPRDGPPVHVPRLRAAVARADRHDRRRPGRRPHDLGVRVPVARTTRRSTSSTATSSAGAGCGRGWPSCST